MSECDHPQSRESSILVGYPSYIRSSTDVCPASICTWTIPSVHRPGTACPCRQTYRTVHVWTVPAGHVRAESVTRRHPGTDWQENERWSQFSGWVPFSHPTVACCNRAAKRSLSSCRSTDQRTGACHLTAAGWPSGGQWSSTCTQYVRIIMPVVTLSRRFGSLFRRFPIQYCTGRTAAVQYRYRER
jgi:hypothetical protein